MLVLRLSEYAQRPGTVAGGGSTVVVTASSMRMLSAATVVYCGCDTPMSTCQRAADVNELGAKWWQLTRWTMQDRHPWQLRNGVHRGSVRTTAGTGNVGDADEMISGVRWVRSRQFQDRLDLVDMMDGVDLLMESSPVTKNEDRCIRLNLTDLPRVATVINFGLRPRRIWNVLVVAVVMSDLDRGDDDPTLVGLDGKDDDMFNGGELGGRHGRGGDDEGFV
ncbi:hypothetical protein ACLOJK_029354 [Asimina triloba]